jgi:hypothetical protein
LQGLTVLFSTVVGLASTAAVEVESLTKSAMPILLTTHWLMALSMEASMPLNHINHLMV